MSSGRRWIQRLGVAALLAEFLIGAAAFGQGQATPAAPSAEREVDPKSPAGLPADKAAPNAAEPPAAISEDGAAAPLTTSPEGCAGGKDCPSIWSKVPPPVPFPRLGAFFILPTGQGYYSLKDVIKGECREKPPVYPYPPFGLDVYAFYDNNFRYLDDPKNTQFDWLDPIKRIHIGDNWLLSIGGEERIRFSDEFDSRLSGKTNIYEPDRSRIYADLWFRDEFRIFAEYAYVEVSNERNLPPSATDINKVDWVNLFADLKVFDLDCHPVYVRAGRQELNYGSQRLISQTDFPNSPRSFDGIKGFWHGEKLDVDAFMTRPTVIVPNAFNSENDKSNFDGLWTTYRPMKGQALDMYYLYLDNDTPLTVAKLWPGFYTAAASDCATIIGSRYAGDYGKIFVQDFEGMYNVWRTWRFQTILRPRPTIDGSRLPLRRRANESDTLDLLRLRFGQPQPRQRGLWYVQSAVPQRPQLLRLDRFGGTPEHRRSELPSLVLSGQVDYHGLAVPHPAARRRQGLSATMPPAALWNAQAATGAAGTDVGQVFTGIVNFHLSQHSDVEFQYSHLDSGKFIERTGSPLSPDFLFLQYTFRY